MKPIRVTFVIERERDGTYIASGAMTRYRGATRPSKRVNFATQGESVQRLFWNVHDAARLALEEFVPKRSKR